MKLHSKLLKMKFYKSFIIFAYVFLAHFKGLSQMPNDAIYMPKGSICIAPNVSTTQWKQYWEGNLLRENLNLGVHTTQSVGVMVAYGITPKLNIIASLPYIKTQVSAGNLMGQQGLQDLAATLKYNIFENKSISINTALSLSTPISKYVAEFLPMSIGMQSKTAAPRLIVRYKLANGIYAQGSASYIMRAKVQIDRDSYFANSKIYTSNQVAIPNASEFKMSLGVLKSKWQLESFVENFTCVSGDNIRRNDMPFLSNKMNATMLGGYFKFQPKKVGINLRSASTVNGKNTGKSVNFAAGLLLQF